MKFKKSYSIHSLLFILCAFYMLSSCIQMSETINDETAGMNGGFEIVKSGLPVNWLLYTPNTVKEGDFKIVIDTEQYKEGKQSLKFIVNECSSVGGWYSPGFTKQFDATPGGQYKLSFWIKNNGSEFRVVAGGVGPKTGDMKTLLQTSEQIDNWKLYEYGIDIAEEFESLRIEVNITQPGTFWIDDIKIEKE